METKKKRPSLSPMLPEGERIPEREIAPKGGNTIKATSRRGIHQQSLKEQKSSGRAGSDPASGPFLAGPITKDTLITDIVFRYPEAVSLLAEAGLHCIGCQLSAYDTIETGCQIHGFDEATIERLIGDMNRRIAEEKKDKEGRNGGEKRDGPA